MNTQPPPIAVPRVDRISVEEFRDQYHKPGRPVVITRSLEWPALSLWTHEWFADRFGSMEVYLSTNPTHTVKTVRMKLGTYIERILANDRVGGGLYLDQFPVERLPALRRDFSVPVYCPPGRHIIVNLWLGPSTTVVGFHKDNHNPLVQIDNIFVQIRGRKRILLASPDNDPFMYPRQRSQGAYWHSQVDPEAPDYGLFPLFRKVSLCEAVAGPGDIVFVPRNYWHYVRALDRSISMSFWWIPFKLMEVASSILQADDAQIIALSAQQSQTIAARDVEEAGGVRRLAEMLTEFSDQESLQRLRRGLSLLADDEARGMLDVAFAACNPTPY